MSLSLLFSEVVCEDLAFILSKNVSIIEKNLSGPRLLKITNLVSCCRSVQTVYSALGHLW